MTYNDLAEKFNAEVKELDILVQAKKYDEALKHIDTFENEIKPTLNSCVMTCEDFAEREKFNANLRKDAMNYYSKCETIHEKKDAAKMYNMAQKELYELWTSWKAVVKQFESAITGWKAGIKQTKNQQQQKA